MSSLALMLLAACAEDTSQAVPTAPQSACPTELTVEMGRFEDTVKTVKGLTESGKIGVKGGAKSCSSEKTVDGLLVCNQFVWTLKDEEGNCMVAHSANINANGMPAPVKGLAWTSPSVGILDANAPAYQEALSNLPELDEYKRKSVAIWESPEVKNCHLSEGKLQGLEVRFDRSASSVGPMGEGPLTWWSLHSMHWQENAHGLQVPFTNWRHSPDRDSTQGLRTGSALGNTVGNLESEFGKNSESYPNWYAALFDPSVAQKLPRECRVQLAGTASEMATTLIDIEEKLEERRRAEIGVTFTERYDQ